MTLVIKLSDYTQLTLGYKWLPCKARYVLAGTQSKAQTIDGYRPSRSSLEKLSSSPGKSFRSKIAQKLGMSGGKANKDASKAERAESLVPHDSGSTTEGPAPSAAEVQFQFHVKLQESHFHAPHQGIPSRAWPIATEVNLICVQEDQCFTSVPPVWGSQFLLNTQETRHHRADFASPYEVIHIIKF